MASILLPKRFRGEVAPTEKTTPSWASKRLTPIAQFISRLACSHPIHTVVLVAVLASTSYVGLLQESFFSTDLPTVGKADWSSLVEGSRVLRAGPETSWNWKAIEQDSVLEAGSDADHLALLTLVFPDTLSAESSSTAPRSSHVPVPQNLSITPLPSTENSFTAYSQDSILAYSLPYAEGPEFLAATQEIPSEDAVETETQHGREKKTWIMKAAKVNTQNSIVQWVSNAWTEFLDLLKNAETLDIVIMFLGYIAMHLTFVSLFLSMRKLGSKFWLGFCTLFSSVFSLLFVLLFFL
jgi:hydroxymethylglutaryl-CoA reductase (NADPH)